MNTYHLMLEHFHNTPKQVEKAYQLIVDYFNRGESFIKDNMRGNPFKPQWWIFVNDLSNDSKEQLIEKLLEEGWANVEIIPTTENLAGKERTWVIKLYAVLR